MRGHLISVMTKPDLTDEDYSDLSGLVARGHHQRTLFPLTPDEAAQEHPGEARSSINGARRHSVSAATGECRTQPALSQAERRWPTALAEYVRASKRL